MIKHVIVDGSNIATEGRSKPSLKQLHEAVLAFLEEHPKAAVTVIVDATFGHRIDPKEVPAFNKAVEHNELVTPPAGTVGRGDAFVLGIAEKAGAAILSNDSYQEFHGQYKWLFDEGRLIGGKPVPHVGWVFVERLPVRGEKSRRSERKSKSDEPSERSSRSARKVSAAAMKPMPVPKSPPPGAVLPSKKGEATKGVNDILPFLHFVENHGVGSVVDGVVESYSSHGAYVQIGDIKGYVPLRVLGNPPPRSARDAMKLGESVTLEIVEIIAPRRSVNLKPAAKGSVAKKATGRRKVAVKSTSKAATKSTAGTPAKKRTTSASTTKRVAVKSGTTKRAASGKAVSSKIASAKKSTPSKSSGAGSTARKKAAPRSTAASKTPAKSAARRAPAKAPSKALKRSAGR